MTRLLEDVVCRLRQLRHDACAARGGSPVLPLPPLGSLTGLERAAADNGRRRPLGTSLEVRDLLLHVQLGTVDLVQVDAGGNGIPLCILPDCNLHQNGKGRAILSLMNRLKHEMPSASDLSNTLLGHPTSFRSND